MSHFLLNNTLIIQNVDNVMKFYNINNSNLFWQVNIDKYLSKNEKILSAIINETRIILFFSKGNVIELDIAKEDIAGFQKLKMNKINSISFYKNYIIFDQNNGKINIFKQ